MTDYMHIVSVADEMMKCGKAKELKKNKCYFHFECLMRKE